MTHQILLDPNLGLSAEQFVTAWNAQPERRATAGPQVVAGTSTSYDPTIVEIINLVLIPLAVNLTSSAIYDLIKETVAAARVRKRTRIEQYRQPDGTEVTVITVDE